MKVILFLSSLLLFAACNNAPKTDSTAAPAAETPAAAATPTTAEMLQGKWQSTTDAKLQLWIEGGKIKEVHNGKEGDSDAFAYDAKCTCAGTDYKGNGKGCFTEMVPEGELCYAVLNLTADNLDCSFAGDTGNVNHYKRIK
jgi:hypothetical protein